MSCDERTTRRQGGDAAMTLIRPLRGGDLREVLAIVRQAFPEDSWTLETAKGWLARSPLGAQTRYAVRLEQLIRLARLGEIINFVRLAGVVALRRPATRYCIVADTDGAIVGYACLNAFAGGRGDVQTIAVRDDHQGEGIGTALLTDLIAAAAARGCRDVFLDVSRRQYPCPPALQAYRVHRSGRAARLLPAIRRGCHRDAPAHAAPRRARQGRRAWRQN